MRDDMCIRRVLNESFELDDLGDSYLKRILKIANRTPHSPETLAEVIKLVVPEDAHPRFVSLMYQAATDEGGEIAKRKLRFMDNLFAATGNIPDCHGLQPCAEQPATNTCVNFCCTGFVN